LLGLNFSENSKAGQWRSKGEANNWNCCEKTELNNP